MDKGLVIRLIVFVAAWANNFLVEKGLQPLPVVGEQEAAMVLAFVISVWTLWKNNNITKKARENQEKLDNLPK